ncbi:TonB-dependent receptor [Novosphingobium sp. CF614]|uniref:TonB-dependent receptor n=1 Tax=Novosphingobium sp. CF614 TaxID=1884364 RepID=UPI0015A59E2A|nr:TonB-dependent receptor [Novosphingobium sp. CF614]
MPAFADEDSGSGGNVASDDIVVTARRVEERLQDVPISVSVVSQDRLTTANITSAEDLKNVVPGLNVQSRYSPENANFSIRGFSQELRTSASVGTYFADVVAPRGGGVSLQGGDGAGPGSMFDLQNVQVLKGPQGTLFGRNTTGGAVLLVPKKPTDNLEGYLEGSYGNYNMFRIQGVLNLPLASWARLRLGVDRQTRDGFEHNVSGVGPKDFGNVDYVAARGSLVLDLTPALENYTIVSYSHSDNYGTLPQIWKANPSAGLGALLQGQVARLNASGDPYQIEQKLANPQSLTKQFQVINTTTWLATDNLTVKNIFSFSHIQQRLRQDIFASAIKDPYAGIADPFGFVHPADSYIMTSFSFSPNGGWTNDQKNVTEELQIQGTDGTQKLKYQAGLYFEHSTPGSETQSLSPAVGAFCSSAPLTGPADFKCLQPGLATGAGTFNFSTGTLEYINLAAYAQATYALTEQLKLTGGLRYTYDRTRGTSTGLLYRFSSGGSGNYGTASLAGCQPKYATFAGCSTPTDLLKTSTKRPTWTVNASYTPFDEAMFYASYSRGYRQGSAAPLAVGGNLTFEPESVDSYELGVKTSFQGAISGYVNLAGFYSNLKKQQLQIGLLSTLPGTAGQTATSIFNAGKSRIYGLDMDGMIRFTDWFRVTGSATYLNTEVKSLDTALFDAIVAEGIYNVIQPSAGVGDPLPYSPKWGVNITPAVAFPIGEDYGKLELAATYRYSSSYSTEASVGSDAKASAVKQLDLSLNWSDVGGQPIDISAFATNVTKQVTYTLQQTLYTSFGFNQRYLGQPRMYGMRLRVRFGDGVSN